MAKENQILSKSSKVKSKQKRPNKEKGSPSTPAPNENKAPSAGSNGEPSSSSAGASRASSSTGTTRSSSPSQSAWAVAEVQGMMVPGGFVCVMASSSTPLKAQCFMFSAPADTAVDEIMDTCRVTADPRGLQYLQYHCGVTLLATVSSMAVTNRLIAQGSLVLRDAAVPLEAVGAHAIHVSVYSLPPCMSLEALVQVLNPYESVKAITHATFRDRPDVKTAGAGRRVTLVQLARHHVVTGLASSTSPPPAALSLACGVAVATQPPTAPQKKHAGAAQLPRDTPALSSAIRSRRRTFPPNRLSRERPCSVLRRVSPSPAIDPATGSSRRRFPKTPPSPAFSPSDAATTSPAADFDDLGSNSDRLVIADEEEVTPALRVFGFPEAFIALLRSLYSHLTSRLLINGWLLKPFPVTRGVRQGCPLSLLLYVLSLDPLLGRLTSCSEIPGFPSPGQGSVLVSDYADDICLFVRDSERFEVARKLFSEYGTLSGASLNCSKSQAPLFYGVYPPTLPTDVPVVTELRVLGVVFDYRSVAPRPVSRFEWRAVVFLCRRVQGVVFYRDDSVLVAVTERLGRGRSSGHDQNFFFGLRLTFVHDGGNCDRHSTKANTRPATGRTPPHREKGKHATPPTPWLPRRDLIPTVLIAQYPPRWRGTNYSWFEASSEHDLVARSPREERPESSP
ncbi:hypothetical protein ISCGN_010711 [Ixodes scapularis]